jgi:hypothetical protein
LLSNGVPGALARQRRPVTGLAVGLTPSSIAPRRR